jgi:hypothetical protein
LGYIVVDWDSTVTLLAKRDVTLDIGGIWEDCRLGKGDCLLMTSMWHSPQTSLRGIGTPQTIRKTSKGDLESSIEVPGHSVAGDVVLISQLTLSSVTGDSRPTLAPAAPGSILWQDEYKVTLEGGASRFPVEKVDFSSSFPSGAGWILDWDKSEPGAMFLGCVRLYLNSEHECVCRAVEGPLDSPSNSAIVSSIYFDVGRTLVRGMLADEGFRHDYETYEDGTVGGVVTGLMKALFPGETPEELFAEMRERSEYFDARLQHGLRVFNLA